MAFVVRSKDNPGDVGRAADQQQSIDNESALYAAVLGGGPVATGGMVRQFVKKTGLVDATTTTIFTITTTNEAGNNDGGVYACIFEGIVAHGTGPTLETSGMTVRSEFSRAVNGSGAAGNNSTVTSVYSGTVAASTAATKTIAGYTFTAVETSEYVVTGNVNLDISGATITTGDVAGLVTLYYFGFATPPVITSAG